MRHTTRRDFLQTTAAILTATLAGTSFDFIRNKVLLSFTTLGCPDWTFPDIVKFARENDYDGLELRGIQRELNLTKCKEFNSADALRNTRKLMDDGGLKFVGLGASAHLHDRDP